jgi:uncharacterized membrane protein (DUF4010 family)
VRTFALVGLLGGASPLLVKPFGAMVAAVGLLGLTGLFATAQVLHGRARPDQIGITVPVAGLLTFVLGALAASGEAALAGAAAVFGPLAAWLTLW